MVDLLVSSEHGRHPGRAAGGRPPREAAWAILADPADIADAAPNLRRAVTEGEGVGMQRRCWDLEDRVWDETCIAWEEGERYAFEVDGETSESPVHRLLHDMTGTFGADDRGEGAVLWVEFEMRPRFGPLGGLLLLLARPVVRRGAGRMLDNWVDEIETEAVSAAVG